MLTVVRVRKIQSLLNDMNISHSVHEIIVNFVLIRLAAAVLGECRLSSMNVYWDSSWQLLFHTHICTFD